MKREMKKIFPAFLSLVNLLAFEVLNHVDAIKQNLKIDLQTIGNTLLLILSTYSIWRIIVENIQNRKHLAVHYLNNLLIVSSAFLLNINVFKNEIAKISDIFIGWHAWWSIWFGVLILCFTGIGKWIFEICKNTTRSIGDGAKCLNDWTLDAIKSTRKGVIFSVVLGLILWPFFLSITNKGRNEFSIEAFFRESLVYWCGWFIICIIIFFLINFSSKMGQAVNDIKNTNVIKFFIWAVIGVAVLFVALQVFPSLFPVIGNMLLLPIIIVVLSVIALYTEKDNLFKVLKIKWTDLAVVCGVVIGVTFIFLPMMGAESEEGQSILVSNNIEDFKTLMELITAGLEFVKELL